MGDDEWARGTIVKQYYREAIWTTDRWMPYQVQLESGDLIWAPADAAACIRSARA